MDEFTKDSFLGGGIRIWQPKKGYRAGIDPILLAASVNVSAGQKVLDLGCGVGTASFAIGYRVKNVELYGIEIQKVFVDLAHTPDALEKTLISLIKSHGDNISLVFGCGGERDFKKRPIMAKIASDFNKPNGQYTIEAKADKIKNFMGKLGIRKIPGIGKVTEHIIKEVLVRVQSNRTTHRFTCESAHLCNVDDRND